MSLKSRVKKIEKDRFVPDPSLRLPVIFVIFDEPDGIPRETESATVTVDGRDEIYVRPSGQTSAEFEERLAKLAMRKKGWSNVIILNPDKPGAAKIEP